VALLAQAVTRKGGSELGKGGAAHPQEVGCLPCVHNLAPGSRRLSPVGSFPQYLERLCRDVNLIAGVPPTLLLLFGSEPKLLHEAQVIVAVPVLDYLASLDAANGDALELYLPPGGGTKLLCLSLVSTAYRHAGDDLVSFGYHILNGYVLRSGKAVLYMPMNCLASSKPWTS